MTRRPPAAGVGTIEVLVSLTLFSLVLVGLIGLMIGSMSTGATAESFSIASNLARHRLDQVADDVRRSGVSGAYPSTIDVGGRTYTFTTTLANLAANLVNVQVRVDYQVVYGSACAHDGSGPVCTGNVRTYFRTLQTQVRRP